MKCSDLHKILYRHRFGARAQRPHPTRPNRGIAGDAVVIDDQGKVGSTTVAAATPHHEATAQQPKPTFLAVDGATEVMADEARRYAKVCTVCKRMIVWRSKFSKCWPTLKYCSHECTTTSTSIWAIFLHQRWHHSAVSRGLQHAARHFVLIGVRSALLCPNLGLQAAGGVT